MIACLVVLASVASLTSGRYLVIPLTEEDHHLVRRAVAEQEQSSSEPQISRQGLGGPGPAPG